MSIPAGIPGPQLRRLLAGDPVELAPLLLGATLTTCVPGEEHVTLRLTELEAYRGAADPASHAFRGRTARNATMFAGPGRLYVYWHMGVHFCLNIVVGPVGSPGAILVRSGQVMAGAQAALRRRERGRRQPPSAAHLASGPGNVGRALGAQLGWDGSDLIDGSGPLRLSLAGPPTPSLGSAGAPGRDGGQVSCGPRVGVCAPGADAERFAWRFWLTGDPSVSRYRPCPPQEGRRTRAKAT